MTRQQESEMVFDLDGLKERLEGNETYVARLLDICIKSTTQHLKSLNDSVERECSDDICLQAHTIKGAAANIGADSMMKIAESMELAAKAGQLSEMKSLYWLLERSFTEFRQVAEAYLQNSKHPAIRPKDLR